MNFQSRVKYALLLSILIGTAVALDNGDEDVNTVDTPTHYGTATWRCFYQYRQSEPIHRGVADDKRSAQLLAKKDCENAHKTDMAGCDFVGDCVFK